MHSLTQTPPLDWPIRIYYEDTDAGGIVYYANYLKYFERARTEWFRHFGLNQQAMHDQFQAMFVVRSTVVEYYLPAHLDDELIISTEVEKLGKAVVIFVQKIWRGTECLVEGYFKIGCVHSETIRPRAIPSEVMHTVQSKSHSVSITS